MDCALRLRERHRLRPEEIAEIRCRTADGPVPRLWEPLAAKHAPPNGYAAKFSLPYLLASILVAAAPAWPSSPTTRPCDEPPCWSVAGRVRYELDRDHRLPAPVRRRRRGPRWPTARVLARAAGSPARRARRPADARGARGQVPRQRRAGAAGRAGRARDPELVDALAARPRLGVRLMDALTA